MSFKRFHWRITVELMTTKSGLFVCFAITRMKEKLVPEEAP